VVSIVVAHTQFVCRITVDARSSEQCTTREQASGNDGMTPKFDEEIPYAPCWQ